MKQSKAGFADYSPEFYNSESLDKDSQNPKSQNSESHNMKSWEKSTKQCKAVFAGSFDPPTLGHLSIIQKAYRLFKPLYVVIGLNERKTNMFSVEERIEMLEEMIRETIKDNKDIHICSWDGLTVDFAKLHNVFILVRGVRNSVDFEYEYNMANINMSIDPFIQTVFIPADSNMCFISSQTIKEKYAENQDVKNYMTEGIYKKFKTKYNSIKLT